MQFDAFLKVLVDNEGSDLYLNAGAKIAGKFHGKIKTIASDPLTSEETHAIAYQLMSSDQQKEFERCPEMNLAIERDKVGRFRVNIFKQCGQIGLVIRHIKTNVPKFETLGLPEVLKKLVFEPRGLVLFVGATGVGKSTSLASLIDLRNSHSTSHIVTIEDPIEFLHQHKQSIISQREVGIDTVSYGHALKNTLRQSPDVILIGEIRDLETMEHALNFAETGHLVLSTLHANNANQAIERIINFFPEDRHRQILNDLSLNLKGMVSQRLVPTRDGKRVAATEVLLGSPLVKELIKRGDVAAIKDIMEKSETLGMQTFDTSLFQLYTKGLVSREDALREADHPNNLRLRMNLSTPDKQAMENAATAFSLQDMPEEVSDDRGMLVKFAANITSKTIDISKVRNGGN